MKKPASAPLMVFFGWLALLTLIPFIIILAMSFLKRSDLGGLEFVPTLANYSRCFHWLYFRVVIKTLILALSATTVCLLVGFPVAYYLAKCQGKRRQIGLILLFVPFWTNFILRIYGIISLVGNQGLINQLLMSLGIISAPFEILYTRVAVFLGLTYNYLPFIVIPVFSALEKLDGSLKEAAADLGANRYQAFFRVTLPNIKEGVLVGSLFVFIPMLGEYVIPDLLGGAKEAYLGNILVNQFFVMQDWPFGAAIAGFMSVLMIVGLYLQNRWQRAKGEYA